MIEPVTQLTDRAALMRNRARASGDLFLHAIARDEIFSRLSEVNREFTNPVIVTGHPTAWAGFLPDAKLVEDRPVLEVATGAHDLLIHAMALHWADDPVGQLVQSRRALRPDGLFLGVMLGGQTLAGLRSALAQAESDIVGGLSPRVLPMAEIRDLGALLQRAGFALPVADSLAQDVSYRDFLALCHDLRAMGESNALANRSRRPMRRAILSHAAALYAQHHSDNAGRLTARYELIFLTGWAPDESQPRPLRPGSAQARLADALGTRETTLPDSIKIPGSD